jgi:hypothetical protein
MNETKQNELAYSGERVETTRVETPPEVTKPLERSENQQTGQFSKQTQVAALRAWPQPARTGAHPSLPNVTRFLKQTKHVWLSAAGTILALMAVVTLATRASEWARNAHERRQEHAVATLTPDALIARCGQPPADVSWEVYPILMRAITYQPASGKKVVVAFSRTAEEKSDWVFLSMKDESGVRSYDTSETRTAALPCLDSDN